jgi:plasmid stabilization system protein ParE
MWQFGFRPEFHHDVTEAADWYDRKQRGPGTEFIEEVIRVLDALAENPLLNSRRHHAKNIHSRYPERFPYRVIYEAIETEQRVIVAAPLHAARHDREWLKRLGGS